MKKIFIDATALCRKRTGIESYAFNLLRTLLETDRTNEYHMVFRKKIDEEIIAVNNDKQKCYLSPFASQLLTEQIYIPFFILKNRFDLHFFPCFPPGILVFKKISLMVFDATMWKYTQYLSLKNRLYFKPLWEKGLKRAQSVFTISKSSEQDIVGFFNDIKGKIHNINAAIPQDFKKVDSKEALVVAKKLAIDRKFLLCVGSLEPRKNIPFIIKSCAKTLRENDFRLVLTGRKAWGHNSIDNAIKEEKLETYIIKTGFVSDYELRCLYSCAEIFLFPSLYEGFGFPILEAFACECAVITSNTSSMPEVAGDAALLVDPVSQESIHNAVSAILDSEILRNDLIRKGMNRLKCFSWDETARNFLRLVSDAAL